MEKAGTIRPRGLATTGSIYHLPFTMYLFRLKCQRDAIHSGAINFNIFADCVGILCGGGNTILRSIRRETEDKRADLVGNSAINFLYIAVSFNSREFNAHVGNAAACRIKNAATNKGDRAFIDG